MFKKTEANSNGKNRMIRRKKPLHFCSNEKKMKKIRKKNI